MNIRYSIKHLDFILSHYWMLKNGQMVFNGDMVIKKGKLSKSPFETAICWVSDVDRAIGSLAYKSDNWCILSRTNLETIEKYCHKLSHRQQAVIRFYLLGEKEGRTSVFPLLKQMCRFLNYPKKEQSTTVS